jgi:three-Cys-motif partner protein
MSKTAALPHPVRFAIITVRMVALVELPAALSDEPELVLSPFFDKQSARSQVKARITAKFFRAWASVVKPSAKKYAGGRIAYIDLFAGPGRYTDDSKSTALLVIEQAIQDPELASMVVSVLNDGNRNHSKALEKAISDLTGVEKLKHKPVIYNDEIGDQIVQTFESKRLVPTFFFVDPFGYKGLSLRLVNSVLKDWGCDCLFFFNYNRINMGLRNRSVEFHMNQSFGNVRADDLRTRLASLPDDARRPAIGESLILRSITDALHEMGGTFVLPFCFKDDIGTRTSHYLVFVTKNFKGYEIMKSIMAKESTTWEQGVPSFIFNPAPETSPTLFPMSRPLDELQSMLLSDFRGRSVTVRHLYEEHSNGRPYISVNYKAALRNLEAAGKIEAIPPAAQRKRRNAEVTFADTVRVKFPAE